MSKKGPTPIPHCASWNQHRNKWQSKEYWGKERSAANRELQNQFMEHFVPHFTPPFSIGDKVLFKGVPELYYPKYTTMKTKADAELIVGEEYEVSQINVFSSWVGVWLKDHRNDESCFDINDCFNSSFFIRA